MNRASPPPRLARWLLERALPGDVREDVSGDLEEMFQRRRSSQGAAAATWWYWRQAGAFSVRFWSERARDRRKQIDMNTGFSWMDVKLAARMLVRYPGLTVIGALGMAVAITIAAGAFSVLYTLSDPALPLDEGERIVTLESWDPVRNRRERRLAADVAIWRTELQSIGDIGAFRQVTRNLIAAGGPPETVRIAEMSASGFQVARVPPLLGRQLLEQDERPGAEAVLVIGYDVWRTRFSADPAIVGRTVQLGDERHSIVGVMPEGFAFPVRHSFWTPLRLAAGREPRTGPELTVFGRLASGVTLDAATAELQAWGQRAASAWPKTHEKLRPRVLPYTFPFFDIDDPSARWMIHVLQLLITLLLVIVCVNVGILVYARTATRHAEIAVRTALGASRGRIIGQLFVEALALAAVAAVLGLGLTSYGLREVNAAMQQIFTGTPFWWEFRVSSGVVLYVIGLTVLAAAIVGVLPALRATGRSVQANLQRISAGGGAGMQLGRTWTVLIVVQVAIAVALLPAAVFHAWDAARVGMSDPGFSAREYLATQLVLDRPSGTPSGSPEHAAHYASRHVELVRRLTEESAVSRVITASSVPGGEPTAWIEAEGVAIPDGAAQQEGWVREGTRAGHEVRFNKVDLEYFSAFSVPLLAGRALTAADTEPAADAIVVNESLARDVFGGAPPLGRRIRYVGASGDAAPGQVEFSRWYEVVGIVGDFPAKAIEQGLSAAKLYHAAKPGSDAGAMLLVHLRGADAAGFAGRLREIGAAVDPNLQLRNINGLDAMLRAEQSMLRVVATVLIVLTISVLLVSSAGIYALMSFTVAQRRKEIGIRAALGADPRQILQSIFSRALAQLAIGAALGVVTATILELATEGGLMQGNGLIVLPIVASIVTTIGLLAVLGPARRGLRVQPTDALREQ